MSNNLQGNPNPPKSGPSLWPAQFHHVTLLDERYSFKIELLNIELERAKLDVKERQLYQQFISSSSNPQMAAERHEFIQKWVNCTLKMASSISNLDSANETISHSTLEGRRHNENSARINKKLDRQESRIYPGTSPDPEDLPKKAPGPVGSSFHVFPSDQCGTCSKSIPNTSPPSMNHTLNQDIPSSHQATNDIKDLLRVIELRKSPATPFDGNPKDFNLWYYPLKSKVKNLDPQEAIEIFAIHSIGEPRQLINLHSSATSLSPEIRYLKILEELKRRFGSEEAKGMMLYEELLRFPRIADGDSDLPTKLRKLSDLCIKISYSLQGSNVLAILDTDMGLRTARKKLPTDLSDEWRYYKYERRGNNSLPSAPKFDIFCEFLKEKSDSINADYVPEFILNYTDNLYDRESENPISAPINVSPCPLHPGTSHNIFHCTKFMALDNSSKMDIVRKNQLCEKCLTAHHHRNSCPEKLKCSICLRNDHHSASHTIRT